MKRGRRSCEVSADMPRSKIAGPDTFRVVFTDMLPSIRSRVQAMWWVAKAKQDMHRVSLKVVTVGSGGMLTHPG